MNSGIALGIFLVAYALVGAAFATNIWGISDRAAQQYRGKPWLIRQIGRDNPNVWRGGGFIMFAFGVAMVAGLLLLDIWNPPTISSTAAIAVLVVVATVACVWMLLRQRQTQKPSTADHPPEPPDGRNWG